MRDKVKIIPGNTVVFILLTLLTCLKVKPAIIHSHANWYCIVPAVLYKAIRKAGIIHTIHSVPERKYSRWTRFGFNWLLQRCDHVNFVSFFLKDYYITTEKIVCNGSSVVYPGSDHALASLRPGEREQFLAAFSIPGDAEIIVAQGLTAHFLKYRGACLLLEAFSRLQPEFSRLVLVFTKDGKYVDLLKQKVRDLNMERSVFFTYDLETPLIANAVAHIYAHITFTEGGVSLAVLEAMAAGNPVVATRAGGIPELLTNDETALLVDAVPDAVYGAIKQLLLNDALRQSIGSKAKHYVMEQFTWNSTAEKFIELYNTLQVE